MAINSSEGIGEEREVVRWLCMLGTALTVWSSMIVMTRVECLCIKIRGKAKKADDLLGVCYRPPNQDEEVDEVFYKRLAEDSELLALVLMEDFNLPDICWKYNTAERKQSRRFLECVEDNFLMQLVSEPTRGVASLDLLFTNRDVVVGGCLGLSDHEMVEFSVHGVVKRGARKTST